MDIKTITIFNRSQGNGADSYLRTVLSGCHVFYQTDNRSANSNSAVVRVMEKSMDKPFAHPQLWKTLTHEQRLSCWTAQDGDIIIIGDYGKGIQRPSEPRDEGFETISVKGYTDNRRGIADLRHIKVIGA